MDSNFFDKIQDTVIMAGHEFGQAAKDLTEKAKLQYEIKTRESYLNDLYKELGKKYYTEHNIQYRPYYTKDRRRRCKKRTLNTFI